jgi:hypothetical protein
MNRCQSGRVHFSGRHNARLPPEVFGNDGHVMITDLIFPAPCANSHKFFTDAGTAQLIGRELA